MYRDLMCGKVSLPNLDKKVKLAGWVSKRRDHGQLIFIDLRDRWGIVQVVFDPESDNRSYQIAESIRNEWVVKLTGYISSRPKGTENMDIATGEIEMHVQDIEVLNESLTPPFYVNEESDVEETIRLKYRYLDLRRRRMASNLQLRHNVVKFIRDYLSNREFLEIETPILMKSTPEGARDYLVPSRVYPGQFFALPQSPQQLKQLLMMGGIEKYFQIARCFRDEDLRADRQPEFTQLDVELSFVDENDILSLMEDLFTELIKNVSPDWKLPKQFPRFTYEEAIDRFGSDKPDLRFDMELNDITDLARESGVAVFKSVTDSGGIVKAISVPNGAEFTRKQISDLTNIAISNGAKGLATIGLNGLKGSKTSDLSLEDIKSPLAKYLDLSSVKNIAATLGSNIGDMILMVADQKTVVNHVLGVLRAEIGTQLNLQDTDTLAFAFITDFPLFEWKEEKKGWEATHHPFTAPNLDDWSSVLHDSPGKVRSRAYDIVVNGFELGSGSIRIHNRSLQEDILKFIGYSSDSANDRFGHLLEALDYGAPPHGGFAAGIDRLVAILAKEPNIREVISFPKTQTTQDLLTQSPSRVDDAQLDEIGIKILSKDEKI